MKGGRENVECKHCDTQYIINLVISRELSVSKLTYYEGDELPLT